MSTSTSASNHLLSMIAKSCSSSRGNGRPASDFPLHVPLWNYCLGMFRKLQNITENFANGLCTFATKTLTDVATVYP